MTVRIPAECHFRPLLSKAAFSMYVKDHQIRQMTEEEFSEEITESIQIWRVIFEKLILTISYSKSSNVPLTAKKDSKTPPQITSSFRGG